MDIGIGLPTTVPGLGGPQLVDFARRADRGGFSTLAVFDRLVYDNYDSLVALAAAAAVTERIRLATAVLLAAYRPSVAVLAKQLASIDNVANGRLVLGVAAGGREDDFDAAGTVYQNRGKRLDEMIAQLRRIWAGQGDPVGPRPVKGNIPLWVGGHSTAALRRAAEHGEGWISPGGSAAAYPDLVRRAGEAFAAAGRAERPRMIALANVAYGEHRRDRAAAHITRYYAHVGPKSEFLAKAVITDEETLRATVRNYAAAGCDELLLFPNTSDPEQVDEIAKVVFR